MTILCACPYCKRPDIDGIITHAYPCAGLDRVDMNRLQYDALVAAVEPKCPCGTAYLRVDGGYVPVCACHAKASISVEPRARMVELCTGCNSYPCVCNVLAALHEAPREGLPPFTHWSKDPLVPYVGCECSSCVDARQEGALQALADQAQALDMGYGENSPPSVAVLFPSEPSREGSEAAAGGGVHPRCMHPVACMKDPSGYCAPCHATAYP